MLRSVHMKLVMIMVLLILSLMAVVGAFLINSVMAFYLEEFYTQMSQVFDQSQNPALSRTLQTENSGEENGAEAVLEIMQAYSGELGLDGRSRTLYILDGETGAYLAGTDEAEGRGLEYNSPNLTRALVEKEEGNQANIAADYMDVALPFSRGDVQYVIYILDNKTTVNNLINQIFVLILESLVFGLFISILLSFLLSKTMIIPIQRLTEGAMRVAEGDFSRRIEVTSRDEIGVLTDTFNDMAGQLQETLRQGGNERNKLDTLFLHMTDGVVAFSREGTVIHSNPAAAQMLRQRIGEETSYDQLFGDIASLEQVLELIQESKLFQSFSGALHSAVSQGLLEVTTSAAQAVAGYLAREVARMALFLICFALVLVGWTMLSRVLDLAFRLPVLSTLNHWSGAAVGLGKGCVLLFIACWLFRGLFPAEAVEQSVLLRFFCGAGPLALPGAFF